MQMGPWQILVIGVIVLVLFGRGKIAGLMGEVGKGITSFKKGIKESTDEIEKADPAPAVMHDTLSTDKDKA